MALGGFMKSVLLLTAAFTLLAACSVQNPQSDGLLASNIIGGTQSTADFQSRNGIVALVINRPNNVQDLCAGVLIHRRVVLTAAHCLDRTFGAIESIAVVFSLNINTAQPEQVRFGTDGLPHQGFSASAPDNSQTNNDIALLKLDQDAPENFQLTRIASADTSLQRGMKLTEAGFGDTRLTDDPRRRQYGVLKHLHDVDVITVSADLKEVYLRENSSGSCYGDSGGPAFLRDSEGNLILAAINSRGSELSTCLGTGIYTNIISYLEWIEQSKNILLNPDLAPVPPAEQGEPQPDRPQQPEKPIQPGFSSLQS